MGTKIINISLISPLISHYQLIELTPKSVQEDKSDTFPPYKYNLLIILNNCISKNILFDNFSMTITTFNYFVPKNIFFNGCSIAFAIFDNGIPKDIFFNRLSITFIVSNDSISKNILFDSLSIALIITNDGISKNILFDSLSIAFIITNDDISKDILFDSLSPLINSRILIIVFNKLCTIALYYIRSQNKLGSK